MQIMLIWHNLINSLENFCLISSSKKDMAIK